jgi:methyl-accepting chemotaxis protein
LQIELLRSSFRAVAGQADLLAERFYARLFRDAPEIRQFFDGIDLADQRRKLIQSLQIVLRTLDRPEALARYLQDLGQQHRVRGISSQHDAAVHSALLSTLAETAGPEHWTEDLAQEWAAALAAVSQLMWVEEAAEESPAAVHAVGDVSHALTNGTADRVESVVDDLLYRPAVTPAVSHPLDSADPLPRGGRRGLPDKGLPMSVSGTSDTTSRAPSIAATHAEQFYGMVEGAPLPLFFADNNGVVTFMNRKGQDTFRKLAENFGFGPEQLVGGNISRLWQMLPTVGQTAQTLVTQKHLSVQLGEEHLDFVLIPSFDDRGTRIGTIYGMHVMTERVRAERERAEMISNQQAVSKMVVQLELAKTQGDCAKLALETVRELFGWDYASYWAVDPKDRTLRFRMDSGSVSAEFRRVTENAGFAEGTGLNGRAWRQKDLVFVEDLTKVTDCVRAPAALSAGVKSGVAFPIVLYGQVVGTMDFFTTVTLTLSPHRMEALRTVGRLVSGKIQQLDAVLLKNMVDNMPTPVMMADKEFKISYVNPKTTELLTALEKHLPIKASEMLGQSIDIFHKQPSYQRNLLGNPGNLPRRASIELGGEVLQLLISAVKDHEGAHVGAMVTWEVATERLRTEAEMIRVQNMMDNMPLNVMMANREGEIVYINPTAMSTFKKIEHLLPIPAEQIKGQKMDVFHKDPAVQKRIVGDPKNLPHATRFKLGPETLELRAAAILDKNKQFIGPMVTWSIITEQVKMGDDFERDVKGVVEIVTSAATEMQASSKSLAAASEETARQAQVVAAASEEATRNVETVSSAAEQLSKSIGEIARHVQDASKMTSVAVRDAERTNETIRQLGDSSNEIGQVVKVITSIAQQTNLLALNATIEAARAGEAGKGFAVVANEVKELARQTAKATEEISQKISAIQGATGVAITAIGSIGESIRKINEISTTIASAVEEQTAATNEISRNVGEAAKGTAEVSSNIAGVSQAADEGGRGASDILVAAEGLAVESARLDTVATDFLKRMRSV